MLLVFVVLFLHGWQCFLLLLLLAAIAVCVAVCIMFFSDAIFSCFVCFSADMLMLVLPLLSLPSSFLCLQVCPLWDFIYFWHHVMLFTSNDDNTLGGSMMFIIYIYHDNEPVYICAICAIYTCVPCTDGVITFMYTCVLLVI